MNWFTWRQHRKQILLFVVLLVLFAPFVIPTGMHFWDVYQKALATCDVTNSCNDLKNTLFRGGIDGQLMSFMKVVMLAVPFLLALFLGVPLVAREYSAGTHLLVWMQGVSRRRWLGVKLAWILATSAVITGGFAALATWWWRTGDALYLDRFQPLNFGVQGIVPVAFAVFAVALGVMFGAWFKRTLVAIALTLGVLVLAQMLIPAIARPHYMKSVSYTAPMSLEPAAGPDQPPLPSNAGAAWITSAVLINAKGEMLDWNNPPPNCSFTREQVEAKIQEWQKSGHRPKGGFLSREGGPMVSIECLAEKYSWRVKYHPADRYWNFQRIEAGLYLALALIPLAATYLFVLKRDA